jgi:hypothetical protein
VGQHRDTLTRAATLAAASVMLVVGGCGQDGTTRAVSGPPTTAGPEEHVTEKPGTPQPGEPARGRGVVAEAVRDLTRRLGVDPAEIIVVSAEEVTWRDGSLGCPRPGMLYPQVLTNGSRVVLEAQGRRYEYHAGGRRSAFLCQNPEPPAGG